MAEAPKAASGTANPLQASGKPLYERSFSELADKGPVIGKIQEAFGYIQQAREGADADATIVYGTPGTPCTQRTCSIDVGIELLTLLEARAPIPTRCAPTRCAYPRCRC